MNHVDCPLRRALEILGPKWHMIIIYAIGNEEVRFGDIKRLIPDISEKVLVGKLKDLCRLGIVRRKDYKEIPPKVSYSLTAIKGKDMLSLVCQIHEFGKQLEISS